MTSAASLPVGSPPVHNTPLLSRSSPPSSRSSEDTLHPGPFDFESYYVDLESDPQQPNVTRERTIAQTIFVSSFNTKMCLLTFIWLVMIFIILGVTICNTFPDMKTPLVMDTPRRTGLAMVIVAVTWIAISFVMWTIPRHIDTEWARATYTAAVLSILVGIVLVAFAI